MRNKQIAAYYKKGWTLERIGQKYGVSRERIRQLLKAQGLTGKDGGHAVQMIEVRKRHEEAAERHRLKMRERARKRVKKAYGCSLELWEELGGHRWDKNPNSPVYKFMNIKRLAKYKRDLKWELTLQQWWDLWQKSGKWDQCGTKRGQYVMARIDKNKPYKVGNVKIVKAEDSKAVKR